MGNKCFKETSQDTVLSCCKLSVTLGSYLVPIQSFMKCRMIEWMLGYQN